MSRRNLFVSEIVSDELELVDYQRVELVSDGTADLVLKILIYGITPLICSLGVTGNILSIMILKRHGLQKCSNILLISLAFADLSLLIGFNNVPMILHNTLGKFPYSKGVTQFLYVLSICLYVVDYGMCVTSMSLPVLITIERLVAVFLPLKFPTIVTPKRTWIAVAIAYVYNFSFIAYTCFWYKLDYVFDKELNKTVGVIGRSELFYRDLYAIPALKEIYFSVKVQPLFTLIGCVLIIVKLKIVSRKRIKMTAGTAATKASQSSKTTQTLLAVCLVYFVACVVMALPTYVPEEYISYSVTSDDPTNLGVIMYQVMGMICCLNSSWNFTVYIALNKNFRDTFKEIIGKCPCASRPGVKMLKA